MLKKNGIHVKNLIKKSKLKLCLNFNGVNLSEDFTLLRVKVLKYVKEVGKINLLSFTPSTEK